MGTAAVAVAVTAMGATATAVGAAAVPAVEVGVVRPIRGVAPETEVPVGRWGWLARGGIGGFRDTPMIARPVPRPPSGKTLRRASQGPTRVVPDVQQGRVVLRMEA